MISDSPMFARGVPSICYGLRGLVYCQIDLRGSSTDLHSGSFGGAVANPAFVLAQMIAQMKDRGGHIKIPGFYDDVVALTPEEREAWAKLPFNEKQYRKDFGIPKVFGETDYTTLERTWARPTLEVNGLLSGFTGEGAKTVLPAVAMAKISMRLVPNQDPDKMADLFEAYVRKAAPKTVELTFTRMHGGKPWMTSFDNPFVQAAGRAIEKGFGQTPVFTREGGSIPVVSTFQEVLGLPSVLFGVGLPDENAHAPNEKLDVGNFHGGIIASAYLYDEISRIGVRRVTVSRIERLLGELRSFYGRLPAPPADPFTLFVWEVLSAHSTPRKRDAALGALKRARALTPDAMSRVAQKKLEESVALAGPYLEQRLRALRIGVDMFRRAPDLPAVIRGPLACGAPGAEGSPADG